LSCDLISGLPGQTEASLLGDIDELAAAGAAHISLYDLVMEDETPLGRSGWKKDEDAAAGLWLAGRDALRRAGFEQYEVSNFALSGARSRHNIRYWEMRSWLGAGPGASGTIISGNTAERWTVSKTVLRGDAGYGGRECEHVGAEDLLKDTLLMGFRFIDGPDEALFRERFGKSVADALPRTLEKWRARGALQSGKTALTEDGLLFLSPFLLDCFEELDKAVSNG
jgi:oxygen-independent coproporphyrinogen-3 oxidase